MIRKVGAVSGALIFAALAVLATAGTASAAPGESDCAKNTDKDGRAICKDSSSPYTTTYTIPAPAGSSGDSDVPLVCSDPLDAIDGVDIDPTPGVTATAFQANKNLPNGWGGPQRQYPLFVRYSNPTDTDGAVVVGVRCYDTHPNP